mgnify:CR=1 FL=1
MSDCSCRNFTSQVAHVTLATIQYNIMSYIKRFHNYETIGGLFEDVYLGVKEITVIDCIWEAILEVVSIIAEAFSFDEEVVMHKIIADSRKLNLFSQLAKTA